MIKSKFGYLVLLAVCLGLLCLPVICFLLPWIPFFRIPDYPDNSHTQAKSPDNQELLQSNGLVPAVDNYSKSSKSPDNGLLPPSLNRIQDLEGANTSSQIMQKIEALKNARIELTGLVVDESGDALQDVDVAWSLGYVPPDQNNNGSVKTTATGAFFITNLISPTIHLTPYKAGYTVLDESTGTWFADVPSSKQSPLILRMRKD